MKNPQEAQRTWLQKLFQRYDDEPVGRSLIPALCLSFAFSFLVMLYGPLELFFTNIHEFYFSFWLLLPELLKGFAVLLAACLVGFLLCYLIYVRLYDTVLLAAGVGFVCTYIQGMFLAGHLPPLDGRIMHWELYRIQNVCSVVLWLVVGLIAVLLVRLLHMRRMYKVLTGVSLFLTAILLVTGVALGIMNHGFSLKPTATVTKDQEFTMSTDQNFVILVVDAMDSRTFQELLETDDPEFGEILSDFTYYPDTLCAYPFTVNSIPYILEGQWYENEGDFREFVTDAMEESPLLARLRQDNYRMGAYEEVLIYENDNIYDFENVKQVKYHFTSTRDILSSEMRLVWFKYAPFPLKRFKTITWNEFNWLLTIEGGDEQFWATNWEFYQDVQAAEPVTVSDKCFRFIHIEGAHQPFRYDKDVNVIPSAQGTYPMNMEAAMTVVKGYLDLLKEMGTYDNTAIIVMGDHGYGYEREDTTLGRNNALLAVKGIGDHHDSMQTSQAPISYEDLQAAYQRLLDGKPGDAVFDAKPGDDRVRRFLRYEFTKENHMVEYELRGHAFDIANMTPTGRIFDHH